MLGRRPGAGIRLLLFVSMKKGWVSTDGVVVD
jgi:hypothetical protein